jgi:hypothetical protein
MLLKHLDPFSGAKKRHIFFGLMRVFRREYTILAVMIVIQVVSSFASPVGILRLLKSTLRPIIILPRLTELP